MPLKRWNSVFPSHPFISRMPVDCGHDSAEIVCTVSVAQIDGHISTHFNTNIQS